MISTDMPEEQPPLQPKTESPVANKEDEGISEDVSQALEDDTFKTLKYSLLGPSLLKAGQDKVDQTKVHTIPYDSSTITKPGL